MAYENLSIHGLAGKIGSRLGEEHQGASPAVISYGAEIILGEFLKLALLLAMSILLGMFGPVAVMVITAGSLRLISGGSHCKTYLNCLISSLIVFLGLGAVLQLELQNLIINHSLIYFFWALTIYWIVRWAPRPPDNKPLVNEDSRVARKRWAVALTVGFMEFLYTSGTGQWWVWAATIGLFWQSFTLTPAGYSFLARLDGLLASGRR
ncbi:MAG: accessory gene regulator ArgB-like protein [Bacillota bacterium]